MVTINWSFAYKSFRTYLVHIYPSTLSRGTFFTKCLSPRAIQVIMKFVIKRNDNGIDTRFLLSLYSFSNQIKLTHFFLKIVLKFWKMMNTMILHLKLVNILREHFFMLSFSFFYDESRPIKGITIMMVS